MLSWKQKQVEEEKRSNGGGSHRVHAQSCYAATYHACVHESHVHACFLIDDGDTRTRSDPPLTIPPRIFSYVTADATNT
jgi:hypothetical protein